MCAIKASAQAKNVYELFAGKIFIVPDYQRNYAWIKKNWGDFWDDIKEGLTTNTEHYWGTITLRATGDSQYCQIKDIPFDIYEVVDGQQRITTIYLFLLALSNKGKPAIGENFIKCGNIYRLELGGLNNQFLKYLVDEEAQQPNIKTNKLLKEALDYFENQIQAYGNLDNVSEYLQRITFSLEFVIQDQMLAVKAFESLNDRGKQLTLLDKTKSFLMFYSLRYLHSELNGLINSVFGNVFTNYDLIKESGEEKGNDYIRSNRFSEDELLRFFYHYFASYAKNQYSLLHIGYDYDATAENIFDIFLKGACSSLKNDPQQLNNFTKDFLDSFNEFVLAFRNITQRVEEEYIYKKLFSFLQLNARIYPLIISLQTEGILNQSTLALIESLDVRVYKIRGTDPRADLYRNTISQIKISPNASRIYGNIKDFINDFMWNSQFGSYLSESIYGNPSVKYILWEFEKYRDPSFDDCDYDLYRKLQVEHIFPQTPTLSFPTHGFQDEAKYSSNIDRFGNLCLLEGELNAKVRNMIPKNKSRYYQKSVVPRTKSLGFQIDNQEFIKSNIDEITVNIIDFCVNRWKC